MLIQHHEHRPICLLISDSKVNNYQQQPKGNKEINNLGIRASAVKTKRLLLKLTIGILISRSTPLHSNI